MKHFLTLFALAALPVGLSSCALPSGEPRIQLVSTAKVVDSIPGVIGPLYTINGVALQQYSPKLYTPFMYAHQSLADNEYYRERAIRAASKATVHVGPIIDTSTGHPYEVRRAVAVSPN